MAGQVGAVEIRVHDSAAANEFDNHLMLVPDALQKLLHRAHLAIRIDVLAIRDTDADQGLVFGRPQGDAPDPVTLSKEMMRGEIRNKGAVLLFQSVNTAQDFRIEIHQPEPENVLLLFTAS